LAEELEILLEGCKRGKPKSQEALYKRFAAAMYGICLQYASSEEDAQDIMQEGFLKVFRKMDQVNSPAAFPGWIRKVMINTALEKYRNRIHLQRMDEVKEEAEKALDNGIFENMTCEELVALIKTLTPQYRIVFNLYAIEGYSHKEISEELGISVGTSKSNLSRARAILQEKVKLIYGTLVTR